MNAAEIAALNSVMSQTYHDHWNPQEQSRIDRDIEANRKADAAFRPQGLPAGAEVKIEQLSHAFIFGAHIFNFDQLGTDERNRRYKQLFGTLLNSATIAFYWKKFELEEGKPRFKGEFRDTAEYWNSLEDPNSEPHWRRPATDPVVEFCESKGIRLHGHTLTWGNCRWHMPEWLYAKLPERYAKLLPADNKECENITRAIFQNLTPAQIEALLPEFVKELNESMVNRIIEIAMHYKGRLHSWDVANESAGDFENGDLIPDDAVCKSWYGLMPGDYTYRSFKVADAFFPKEIKLNINDFNLKQCYADQTKDLLARGCKVDIMGAQMHLFAPQVCLDIADGKSDRQSPAQVRADMERISAAGLPLHLSEITITAPNNDARGQAIQAVITRNLYRLWFSLKPMMGVTWWNLVDGCGAPGEPAVSGIFSRDMQPKPAYHALNNLIRSEWMTNTTAKADKDGVVSFRGFRGKYRLSWGDAAGMEQSMETELL